MMSLLWCFLILHLFGFSTADDLTVCQPITSHRNEQHNVTNNFRQYQVFVEHNFGKGEKGNKGTKGTKGNKGYAGKQGDKGNIGQINKTKINELKNELTG